MCINAENRAKLTRSATIMIRLLPTDLRRSLARGAGTPRAQHWYKPGAGTLPSLASGGT